jgi:hypothetical protein
MMGNLDNKPDCPSLIEDCTMKVKRLLIVICALVALACDKQDEVEPRLIVRASTMSLDGVLDVPGVKNKVPIQLYSNQNWKSESDVEWIDVHTKVGKPSNIYQTIEVTVLFNGSGKERSGKLTFRNSSLEQTLVIQQGVPDASAIHGDGTESAPYVIKTAEQMNSIRQYLEPGSATYLCLGNDIDMSGIQNFVPLNDTSPYNKEIHFDGRGFTSSNLTSIQEIRHTVNPSLFGILKGSCTNLTVKDATIKDDPMIGTAVPTGIIASSSSSPVVLNNVHVSGVIRSNGSFAGGLVGRISGATIENCTADINVSASSNTFGYSGGLVGQVKSGKFIVRNSRTSGVVYGSINVGGLIGGSLKEASLEFQDCHSTAMVRGHSYIGGFAGCLDNDESRPAKITDSSASGEVRMMSEDNDLSAFVGMVTGACEFVDCHASGDLYSSGSSGNAGGIIACTITENGTIHLKNCHYKGKLGGSVSTGGVVGCSTGDIIIEDCSAEGNLIAPISHAGGILGLMEKGMATITRSCFKGSLRGKGGVGGIIGYLSKGTAVISECWTEGDLVASADGLGGIVGKSDTGVTIRNCCSSCEVIALDYAVLGVACQAAGGILGMGEKAVFIENCYASGEVKAFCGVGGIAGVLNNVTNAEIHTSLAWSKSLVATRTQKDMRSSGAIAGLVRSGTVTLVDNYRRADLQIVDSFITGLSDHENVIESLPPLPAGITDYNQRPFNGRKADQGATLVTLAKSLGWDAAIWNFNSDSSDMGFSIKPLGDNKIEF